MYKKAKEYVQIQELDELEDVYVQEYIIFLLDSTQVVAYEDYDLPIEKGIAGWFEKAKPEDVILVESLANANYIPKRSILHIATGEVSRKALPYKLMNKVMA